MKRQALYVEVTHSHTYPHNIQKLFLFSQSLFTELFSSGDSMCHALELVIFHIMKCFIFYREISITRNSYI